MRIARRFNAEIAISDMSSPEGMAEPRSEQAGRRTIKL
jgi:hypothetical protein